MKYTRVSNRGRIKQFKYAFTKRIDKGAHEILATFETSFVRPFISRVET